MMGKNSLAISKQERRAIEIVTWKIQIWACDGGAFESQWQSCRREAKLELLLESKADKMVSL